MSNFKGTITHQKTPQNKIIYVVEVTDCLNNKSKITKLRYSQFKEIHQQLQKIVQKLKINIILPQFPGRKLFGATNQSNSSIQERTKDLKQYLNELIMEKKLHCLEIVLKNFIPVEFESTQQLNIEMTIHKYTLIEDVVVYYAKLKNLITKEQWDFKTRYRELRDVHEALMQSQIKKLPNFPKKKIFKITNQSPQDIQHRRQQLQLYFNKVLTLKEAQGSDAIKYFINKAKQQSIINKEIETLRKTRKQTETK